MCLFNNFLSYLLFIYAKAIFNEMGLNFFFTLNIKRNISFGSLNVYDDEIPLLPSSYYVYDDDDHMIYESESKSEKKVAK